MKTNPNDLHFAAESATGCAGAGSYLAFAKKAGFKYLEVLNWSSSAGDWQFIVSRDGSEWYILEQTNNYPWPGFSHLIDTTPFFGTAEEVINELCSMFA